MSAVSTALLEYLLTLTADADVDAVVPHTEDGYHPLCAAYTPACLEPITRRLADGRLKTIDLLGDLRVRVVTAKNHSLLGEKVGQPW